MGLDQEMLRVARIVAADQSLTVEVKGSVAYAGPGRVVLPMIENFDDLGSDAKRMLHGLLDHECGHARWTDFSLFKSTPEVEKTLLNLVEDARIERLQGELYPGSALNLANKNRWFLSREDTRRVLSEDGYKSFLLAATLVSRGTVNVEHFESTFVRKSLQKVEGELRQAQWTSSTSDALRLAKEILKKVPAPKGSGKSHEGGLEEGEASIESPDSMDAGGTPVNPEMAVQVEVERFKDKEGYHVFSYEFDSEEDLTGIESGLVSNRYKEGGVVIDSLVHAFESSLLASTSKQRLLYGLDEGFVDEASLAEFAVGSRSVDSLFSDYAAVDDGRDVAVSILVDCSGSMSGTKYVVAAQTAYALTTALDRVGVINEVTGFTTTSGNEDLVRALQEALKRGDGPDLCSRSLSYGDYEDMLLPGLFRTPTTVPSYMIFRSFGSRTLAGLSNILAYSENLDGEAVMWQARRLAQRPESRRVMFVLSDGYPAGSRNNREGSLYLKKCVRKVLDAGMEVYGIGIESDSVCDFYPTYWVVDELDDLPSIALSGMASVLLKGRREGDVCLR